MEDVDSLKHTYVWQQFIIVCITVVLLSINYIA
jgi:hypothetical protein